MVSADGIQGSLVLERRGNFYLKPVWNSALRAVSGPNKPLIPHRTSIGRPRAWERRTTGV